MIKVVLNMLKTQTIIYQKVSNVLKILNFISNNMCKVSPKINRYRPTKFINRESCNLDLLNLQINCSEKCKKIPTKKDQQVHSSFWKSVSTKSKKMNKLWLKWWFKVVCRVLTWDISEHQISYLEFWMS